ncbi:MAG TPA: mechanosensitive ion channel protein MscS, partial [Allosphingosinicella sp.]|nr:mechanosensitive ion channel protein MscS [Allosphingosinicella sp.]
MRQMLVNLGLAVPPPDLGAAALAAALVLLAVALGWAAGRWGGPRVAGAWERRIGARAEGIAPRMCSMVRYLLIWVLLAVALRVYPWPPLASLLLGLGAASSAALLVRNVVRGLHL